MMSRAALILVLQFVVLAFSEGPGRVSGREQLAPPALDPDAGDCDPRCDEAGAGGSPQNCRPCHMLIHDRWIRGMHRYSFEDPIFQVAYSQVYTESSGRAAGTCLRCHAPSAFAAGDLDLHEPVNRLGVQCAFCHSVESVTPGTTGFAFKLRQGNALASPRPDARSPEEHETWFQPLLRTPEFCAGCHEYVVEGGAAIVSTWSEWKAGPYAAEGKTCQSCHMPGIAKIAAKDGSVRELNDHDLSGGHSATQVRKAGKVEVVAVERHADELLVRAKVENIGSGHALPTGMPSRRLVLDVEVFSGSQFIDGDHRVYAKVVGDSEGRTLTTDGDIKWHGRKIVSDNRLKPMESRTEVFRFRVDPRGDYRVAARLTYSYTPLVPKPEPIQIVIAEHRADAPVSK